jgi:hypothetical protein
LRLIIKSAFWTGFTLARVCEKHLEQYFGHMKHYVNVNFLVVLVFIIILSILTLGGRKGTGQRSSHFMNKERKLREINLFNS